MTPSQRCFIGCLHGCGCLLHRRRSTRLLSLRREGAIRFKLLGPRRLIADRAWEPHLELTASHSNAAVALVEAFEIELVGLLLGPPGIEKDLCEIDERQLRSGDLDPPAAEHDLR